jgi:hypothetical protein
MDELPLLKWKFGCAASVPKSQNIEGFSKSIQAVGTAIYQPSC